MRNPNLTLAALTLLALAAAGCATKKHVAGEIQTVNRRVDGVQTQVEDAQTQLKQHDERLTANSQETQKVSKTAQEALDRAIAAGKLAEGKFLYETVLSDDKIRFGFNKAELVDAAKVALDELAAKLKAENKPVYVEI